MPRFKRKITIKAIAALEPHPTEDTWIWDDELTRFAFRLKPSGAGSYVIVFRNRQRRQRQMLVGKQGVVTPEQARTSAKAFLQEVDAGRDPAATRLASRDALTVSGLCEAYMDAARAGLVRTRFGRAKRPSTIAIDEGRISRHIKPLIGDKVANELRRSDVQKMMDAIAQGKTASTIKTKARGVARVTGGAGTAARVVELFGGIWSWAEKRDLVSAPSPVAGVEKARGEAKDRFLSPEELSRLGETLRQQETARPMAVAALRLIALTGLRREEACGLSWAEVDAAAQCLRLKSTKTGRSMRPIGRDAIDLLTSLNRIEGEDHVFPGRAKGKAADLKKQLAFLFDSADLKDVRAHDLRRTFASIAADEGYSDATIGEMLGHARRGVTQSHYIRRPDAALVEAATRTGARIAACLNSNGAVVVPLSEKRRG